MTRSTRLTLSLSIAAALVLAAAPSHAQDAIVLRMPSVTFGLDIGVSAMNEGSPFSFSDGVGSVTNSGPAWGARLGFDLNNWFGIEARYVGMWNSAQGSVSPTGKVAYLTSGGEAVVRFTAPFPFVRPYVFGGIGYYDSALMGSDSAKAGSVMHSSSEPGVPMGVGFEIPVTPQFSIGAEGTYHFLIGESFSDVDANGIDGGDFTTFKAVFRFRM